MDVGKVVEYVIEHPEVDWGALDTGSDEDFGEDYAGSRDRLRLRVEALSPDDRAAVETLVSNLMVRPSCLGK